MRVVETSPRTSNSGSVDFGEEVAQQHHTSSRPVMETGSEARPGRDRPATSLADRSVGRRLLNGVVMIVVTLTVIAIATGAAGWWRFAVVLSGSMRPGIQPGDVEILQQEPVSDLAVGQIVAFHPPGNTALVSHRVIAVIRQDGRLSIRTKGDANDVADPWGKIAVGGSSIWRVTHVVPKVGYLSVWAQQRALRLLIAIVVVGTLTSFALRWIWSRE